MAINARQMVLAVTAVVGIAGALAASFEGNPEKSYLDRLPLRPTPTACQGHTGPDVQVGIHYSDKQCEAWLQADLVKAQSVVRSCINRPMPIYVEASLIDFTFNVGRGRTGTRARNWRDGKDGICVLRNGRTPKITMLANAGDWQGVCGQFQFWSSAGGVYLKGVARRRAAEAKLCMTH